MPAVADDPFEIQTAGPGARGALGGKVAVVVGGASGLGRTIAKGLTRQGARVVIADFDAARMERTLAELLRLGSADAALGLPTDVRSDASIRSLVRDSIKAMGHVDILINTAGVLLQGRLDRTKSSDWTWMLETNLLGAVRAAAAFVPHMQQRASGHIVNTVAFGGLVPTDPFTVPYDCGHAALVVYTRGLAREVRGAGVHVSLFCPGSRGPRIGQNTRSRGLGRWIGRGDAIEERAPVTDRVADGLIEGLHRPTFLMCADPTDSAVLLKRWPDLDQEPLPAGMEA